MNQTQEFLEALFGQKPETAEVAVWARIAKPITYYCTDLEYAAKVTEDWKNDGDIYIHCGLAQTGQTTRAQRTRLKLDQVVGIPGVWADIDVNGGPDSKEGAAPNIDAALELANSLLEPTVLVNSGYGLQAWWLWEDGPMIFPTRKEQEHGKRLVAGFQGALRAAARRLGWGLDATQDLSRVMRIPGTFNHKNKSKPAPVELMSHDGKLYSISEVGELGQGFYVAQAEETKALGRLADGDGINIKVNLDARLDNRVLELMREEAEFDSLWRMVKVRGQAKRNNWSPSEFEMAICNWLLRAGLSPQECCDALVVWRVTTVGSPEKCREDRLRRTIGKVMDSLRNEEKLEFINEVRETAIGELDRMALNEGEPNEAKTVSMINRLIGGPEIARLKQYSRDPEFARFSLELADGREVAIGPFRNIAQQAAFRQAYATATGHYPNAVKKAETWDKAVQQLLRVAHVNEEAEDSSQGVTLEWIQSYFGAAGSNDRDGACFSNAPFIEEDRLFLNITEFLKWLRRVRGERVERSDVSQRLKILGFERKAVRYTKPDGKTTTASYFVGSPLKGSFA